MKSLVVAEESTEGVDFLIINLIDGDYDTTGLNADRVENISLSISGVCEEV